MKSNEELITEFASLYVDLLKDRDIEHSHHIISFSGIPGSDKTSLARRLAKDLSAQWVQHDDIRQMIASSGFDPRKLSMVLVSRIIVERIIKEDKNKLIVLDLSIDRTWERFFTYCEQVGAKPIVIRINVPIPLLVKRLTERTDSYQFDPERFEEFVMDFENSKKHVSTEFELQPDFDYDALLSGLKKQLAQ
jgi:adenylate kinase family enzyme